MGAKVRHSLGAKVRRGVKLDRLKQRFDIPGSETLEKILHLKIIFIIIKVYEFYPKVSPLDNFQEKQKHLQRKV
uniref:Uncharacterized protein n=1 Tax=Romanomermis culicivorax TaxID=13658 RepID=A0A915KDE8_ROMCU